MGRLEGSELKILHFPLLSQIQVVLSYSTTLLCVHVRGECGKA